MPYGVRSYYTKKNSQTKAWLFFLAEEEGFEPSLEIAPH